MDREFSDAERDDHWDAHDTPSDALGRGAGSAQGAHAPAHSHRRELERRSRCRNYRQCLPIVRRSSRARPAALSGRWAIGKLQLEVLDQPREYRGDQRDLAGVGVVLIHLDTEVVQVDQTRDEFLRGRVDVGPFDLRGGAMKAVVAAHVAHLGPIALGVRLLVENCSNEH